MDIISYLQNKISQSYTEQIWTISTLGIYYGFIIVGSKFTEGVNQEHIRISIWVLLLLGLLFIISRHLIFEHYDKKLKQLLAESEHKSLLKTAKLQNFGEVFVRYSGVTMYCILLTTLAVAAHFSL